MPISHSVHCQHFLLLVLVFATKRFMVYVTLIGSIESHKYLNTATIQLIVLLPVYPFLLHNIFFTYTQRYCTLSCICSLCVLWNSVGIGLCCHQLWVLPSCVCPHSIHTVCLIVYVSAKLCIEPSTLRNSATLRSLFGWRWNQDIRRDAYRVHCWMQSRPLAPTIWHGIFMVITITFFSTAVLSLHTTPVISVERSMSISLGWSRRGSLRARLGCRTCFHRRRKRSSRFVWMFYVCWLESFFIRNRLKFLC